MLNYRLALAYPESLRRKDAEEPKSARYAPFKNMEEWDAYRGAKLQAAVDICLHMLSGDDRPPPVVDPDTAHVFFPELPPLPDGQTRTFKRKILIFHEFPMMDEMVKSVSPITCFNDIHVLLFIGICIIRNQGRSRQWQDEIRRQAKNYRRIHPR